MHRHCDRLRQCRRKPDVVTPDVDALPVVPRVRPKLFLNDGLDARTGPARHREQLLHVGERSQAPLKRRLELFRAIGLGQAQHRLDHREQIVGAVIDLLGQQHHPLFRLLAGGDVDQHVDGADQRAGLVAQRGRIGRKADARTVGPLGDRLDVAHWPVFPDRDRHRTIFVGERRAVRPEQLPGHAPQLADFRRAAREFDAGAVEEGDTALGIGGVNRCGKRLQQLAELLLVGIRVGRGTGLQGVVGQNSLEIGFF